MSSIVGDVNSVKNTFSSWDNCMSKTYCKWPVIAAIIIASFIVLSVVWCVASCLCCGATLCGSCIRCITCFGCCGMCGDHGGGRRSRHKDDYMQMAPTPTPYNGFHASPAPMMYQQPQFAQFDNPGNKSARIHEDSLPAMPSWDTSQNRRVADPSVPHGGDVEMGRLGAMASQQPRRTPGGYNQVPHGPMSPVAEYDGYPSHADIGAQRLGRDAAFDRIPLSPAPTYRTNPPQALAGAVASNRIPRRYDQQDQQPYGLASQAQTHNGGASQDYYNTSNNNHHDDYTSTRYEASDYQSYGNTNPQTQHQSISRSHNYSQVGERPLSMGYDDDFSHDHQGQNQDQRPPSLLQIGRKPVNGSQREI